MTYGNNADLDAYWADNGYAVDGLDDAAKNGLRARASTYVDGLGYKPANNGYPVPLWVGKPLVGGQVSEWPRSGAVDLYGNDVGEGIPERVLSAVYEAAYYLAAGVELNRVLASDQIVTREKVGDIEVQYSGGKAGTSVQPDIPSVTALLAPLIGGGNFGFAAFAV